MVKACGKVRYAILLWVETMAHARVSTVSPFKVLLSQVLYQIYPKDYEALCPRATKPGKGGCNTELGGIVQQWLQLPQPPPKNAKLPQPQGGGVQTAYPVVGRVFVDNLAERVEQERAAVGGGALRAAIQASGPADKLPTELHERIR
eukprot:1081753-Prymnesium_polylepis.1